MHVDSGAPVGETVLLEMREGPSREIAILPIVFSDAVGQELKRLVKHRKREAAKEALKELASMRRDIPDDMYQHLVKAVSQQLMDAGKVGFDEAYEMIQDSEGMARVLAICSPEMNGSVEEARRVISNCRNIIDVMNGIGSVVQEVMEAVKNSDRLLKSAAEASPSE